MALDRELLERLELMVEATILRHVDRLAGQLNRIEAHMATQAEVDAVRDVATDIAAVASTVKAKVDELTAKAGGEPDTELDAALDSLHAAAASLHGIADNAAPEAPPSGDAGPVTRDEVNAAGAPVGQASESEAVDTGQTVAPRDTPDEAHVVDTGAGVDEPASTGTVADVRPLYVHDGGDVNDAGWPASGFKTPDGQALYHFVDDTPGGAAAGDGLGGVWHQWTGATVPA